MYGKSWSKTGCILRICFSTFQCIQPIHGEMGETLLKMQKKKGPKWKKVDLEGPDLAGSVRIWPMKKSKDTLLYQFFVPNPAVHSKMWQFK